MSKRYMLITPENGAEILKSLSAPARLSILTLLNKQGPMNVNDIAEMLKLPQSSASTHVNSLEKAGLIETENQKARKGSQKICRAAYDEVVLSFKEQQQSEDNLIEVAMPVGLYSGCDTSAPCGLCSSEGIIGFLDSPDTFHSPERMKAGLLWFTRGYVRYQFPNNARIAGKEVKELELQMELSSEVPGTSENWPSDINISINDKLIAVWTAAGDYGDRRGKFTPDWWKLAGSQYGHLKSFRVTTDGTYVDGMRVSEVCLSDLGLDDHRSIRVRISVPDGATYPGGINIFGRGFGNYDQDIVLRLRT
ncbi:metalloregulator ArsR/SmtB family transcription factor [uncultured Cohaesibacter sp.]|uniref:ArsR/SmtB family transcription factor n=1 Tax=uncultured Cohaesibacter sp. TaxID=1002546 RepID=UPI00292FF21A|nr:metalloregulator ArsR/SmtB family transcription factor [uncultured Cohaesibacter sp.]